MWFALPSWPGRSDASDSLAFHVECQSPCVTSRSVDRGQFRAGKIHALPDAESVANSLSEVPLRSRRGRNKSVAANLISSREFQVPLPPFRYLEDSAAKFPAIRASQRSGVRPHFSDRHAALPQCLRNQDLRTAALWSRRRPVLLLLSTNPD